MAEPQHNKGQSRQDYCTPLPFLSAVKGLLGIDEFDLDLAATHQNKACPRCFTTDDEGGGAFLQLWKQGEGWNWLNPPFADITPWVQRAYQQSIQSGPFKGDCAQTAMLVPAGVGSNWFKEWVHRKALVLFLNGRLTFDIIDEQGVRDVSRDKKGQPACYPKDCLLLLYSPAIHHGYDVWTWGS